MKLLYGAQWRGARSQNRSITGGHGEARSMEAPTSTLQVNSDSFKITISSLDGKLHLAFFLSQCLQNKNAAEINSNDASPV